jgi:hypothetical protein
MVITRRIQETINEIAPVDKEQVRKEIVMILIYFLTPYTSPHFAISTYK